MSDRNKLPKGTKKTLVGPRKLPAWARQDIEDAIDRLIAVLDSADPDPDIEEDDPAGGDVVDEPHDEVEEGNAEPSLGATHAADQDIAWAGAHGWCRGEDLEFDGETAPSADSEPSLGSPERCPQVHWAQGGSDDREHDDEREWDPAEDGIGDYDGLAEQHGGTC